MFTITRWSVRTIAATVVLGIASAAAQAEKPARAPAAKQPVRLPAAQPGKVNPIVVPPTPKANPIVIPPAPKINPAAIPRVPVVNQNPVRVQPQVNSFPGFPTYPTANPFAPSATNNPFVTPYYNPQRYNNPAALTNPVLNPFNPLNNPLVNNNPLINNNPFINNNPLRNNNPFLLNPFINPLVNNNPFSNPFVNPLVNNNPFVNPFVNPLVNNNPFVNPVVNPFVVNPLTPIAPPVIGGVQQAAYQPGTLVMAGPNTFVNNSTGETVQPITGTTFADGTTFYRAPTIVTPPVYNYPRNLTGGVFTPYIW